MSIKVSDLVWSGYSGAAGTEMVILLALADWCNDDGSCYPSIASIAKKARIQERHAKRVVHALIEDGWISVVGNANGGAPGSTRRYQLNLKRLDTGVMDDTPTGVADDTGVLRDTGVMGGIDGCHGRSKRGVADDTQTVIEPSITVSSKVDQAKPDRLPACPVEQIVGLYRRVLPELPKPRVITKKRRELIQSRWRWLFTDKRDDGTRRATTAAEAMAWLEQFLQRARANDFLMMRTPRGAGHENWLPDLDYLMSDRGLLQVIEKTPELAA